MHRSIMTALSGAALAAAAVQDPPTRIQARATSICGQWDSVETGVYTVYQDLWNEDAGTGSQCTTIDTLSTDDVLSWSTSWSWSGESSQVKSYANTVTNFTISPLSAITAIPSVWSWTYTGSDIVADVSYDMFTSSSATGSDEYEIMVWLDALGGAGPISSTGSAVATPTLAGATWDLYDGYNGDTHVFSFVASSAVSDFDGDLLDFLSYLVDNEGMADSQYLLSIGAGSEPFTGSDAVFSVASYSCGVSTGGSGTATTAVAASSSSSSAVVTSVEASTTAPAAVTSSSSTEEASSAASSPAAASSVASDTAPAPTSAAAATSFSTPSQPGATGQAGGSHSQGGSFPSGQGSKPSNTVTAAAAVTTSAVSAAEPATTLATSTKKSCHKEGSQ